MRLTEEEKREMLEEAADVRRREDFRKARELMRKMTFEQYLRWLTEMTRLFPREPRKPVEYKKVLL